MYHFQVAYNDLNPKAGTGEHLTPEEENRGLLRLSTEYKLPVTACVYVGVGGGGANAGHSYVGSRVHRCSWRLPACLDNTTRAQAETKTAVEGRPLE